MKASNSSKRSSKCEYRRHERQLSFLGDALEEDGLVIYCAPVMRDFRVPVPLGPDDEDTNLRLRRYLKDNPETELILCIEDRNSLNQFAEPLDNVKCVPVGMDYKLVVVEDRVFIDRGILTSAGLEEREDSNLCRHEYATASEFLTKEIGVELE